MIYFDYAASSIKRADLIKQIVEKIGEFDANPDSIHAYGRKAKKLLDQQREIIGKYINCDPKNIIFTSGATESNNAIIEHFNEKNNTIISSNIEHPSILEKLKNVDAKLVLVNPKENGKVDIEDILESIDDNTSLVCLMYVNNETGIIQDVEKLGKKLKEKNIWFHVDAVQALGHLDIDIEKIKCDSMSLSGHKIGGLTGFGVLYLRKNIKSLIVGGDQEKRRRAGTSNIFGAYTMAQSILFAESERGYIKFLKKYLLDKLKEANFSYEINGTCMASDHILNLYLPQWENRFLLTYLDMHGICVSAGSACTAGSLVPSYVIENMYDNKRANHSIRISLGYNNNTSEIDRFIEILNSLSER